MTTHVLAGAAAYVAFGGDLGDIPVGHYPNGTANLPGHECVSYPMDLLHGHTVICTYVEHISGSSAELLYCVDFNLFPCPSLY